MDELILDGFFCIGLSDGEYILLSRSLTFFFSTFIYNIRLLIDHGFEAQQPIA